MATNKKASSVITTDIFGSVLTLTFPTIGETLEIDTTKLADDIIKQAVLHGLKQKLVDAAAIARNPDTGRSPTAQDKFDAVKEVFDRLTHATNPQWNKTRVAGEGLSGAGLLIRALMEMTGKSRSEIEEFLEPKTKEQRAALKKNPKVAAIIARLQSSKDEDTDDMLSELMGDGESDDVGDEETADAE